MAASTASACFLRPGVSVCSWRRARISSRGGSPLLIAFVSVSMGELRWYRGATPLTTRNGPAGLLRGGSPLQILLHHDRSRELGEGLGALNREARAVEGEAQPHQG